MPELTTRRASAREVLLAIRDRVAAVTGLAAERVLVTAADPDDTPHHAAERDVLLRLEGETPQAAVDGGGRYVNLRGRSVAVYCRSRLWRDTRESDLQHLTDASLGHVALEDAVADALEEWIPLDADGNALALPCVAGPFSPPRKDRDDPGWVSSRMDLSFEYLRGLTLPQA